MKSILSVLTLTLIVYSSYAQHTERFLKLVKDLEQVNCKKDTIFYKNGNLKWVICSTNYMHNSEKYWARTGKAVMYYKNGQIAYKYFLDNYGNMKRMIVFDRKGNKVEEYLNTEIDSNAKSLSDFFESQDHMFYTTYCQIYKYSKDTKSYFLYQEGQRVNGNNNGDWVTYYNNGKVKKKKKF